MLPVSSDLGSRCGDEYGNYWVTLGYLLGAPVAGYVLQALGGSEKAGEGNVDVYRPAVFYAGGVALVSSIFALWARLNMAKKFAKRV